VIVVDSSVWIDYFNGVTSPATEKLDALLGTESVATGDMIILEVLQGFRSDVEYKTAKQYLMSLTAFDMIGQHNAIKCAEHYRSLRKRGVTIRKSVDVIIATFCIEQNLPLLFSDRDFAPFVRHLGLRSAL
jgi:predicted nucleic acid-binding protein